ncbi:MAG TPA: serine/threonine-protein kinase [Alphaproteobacteria bacterium]|nr:serine/threonine-protein kinase [Alphaproteobacteria bacterium]
MTAQPPRPTAGKQPIVQEPAAQHRHALPEGFMLEGYRIEGLLGAGGFGLTYRAREIELGRSVAIKEYLPNGIAGRETGQSAIHVISDAAQADYDYGLGRFRDEAQTLVAFRHPNIVTVLRFFQANATAYLVMDYVKGESLEAILKRDGPMPEERLRALLGPLLDGLQNVHDAGFLHRDIKPDNIFVRAGGAPVLIDFGSARQALGGASLGMTAIVSGGYAPIEQYTTHGKQGPWSDIYGLGATLYQAVTGHPPPEAIARIDGDTYILAGAAARRAYSGGLLAAIDAALAMRHENRPQSVSGFRDILGGGLAKKGSPPRRKAGRNAPQGALSAGMTIFATGTQAAQASQAVRATAGNDATERRGSLRVPILVLLIAVGLAAIIWRSEDIGPVVTGGDQTKCLDMKASGPERAIEACVTAIASGKYEGDALAALHLAQGLAHAQRGEHAAAVTALSQALALNDGDKRAYFYRARAHHALRAWAPALGDYTRAIALDATYADAYERRGRLHFDTRQYDKAVADLTRAIDARPTPDAHFYRGQSYLVQRDYIAAFTDFDRAVDLAPQTGAFHRMRGVAHEFLGRRAQAVADYRTALAKDPRDREARDRLNRLGVSP